MRARRLNIMLLAALLAFVPVAGFAAAGASSDPSALSDMDTTIEELWTDPTDIAGPAFDTPEAENPIEAAEDHGAGGLPQLNIATYPSQIFWMCVMFVILYVAFSKSVLPAIGGVVGARDALIKGNLDTAQRLRDEAETVRVSYEQNLDRARADAVKAVQDVEEAAKRKSSEQVELFRRRADADIESAEARVLAVRDGAMGEMKDVAADIASIAAEKITGISTDRSHAQQIVETLAGKAKAA